MKWAGRVLCMGIMMSAYKTLIRKYEGKTPFWRLRYRWEYNVKVDHKL
jgi:hypothetical protein